MKDLQWHEPAAYRRAIYYANERRNPLSSLRFAGAAFLAILALRVLAGLGSDAHPAAWPPSIALAAGVALFAAYALPAFTSLLPGSIVILSDKGVNNNVMAGRGWSIRFWPWEQIAYASTHIETVGGKSYQVMSLHGGGHDVLVSLALAGRPSESEIHAYMAAHGKGLITDRSASIGLS